MVKIKHRMVGNVSLLTVSAATAFAHFLPCNVPIFEQCDEDCDGQE